jgi:hypothetical protein
MSPAPIDLANMFRFDRSNGFLITLDGLPYQAMYRYWRINGKTESVYWLATVDGHMPPNMAAFVYSTFAAEILAEFQRTHL